MKIKVCGMKHPANIAELVKLPIDFMGLIFYPKSSRYIDNLEPETLGIIPDDVKRVGVFVNETIDHVVRMTESYSLDYIQLHGDESPQYCADILNSGKKNIIKAFSISSANDLEQTKPYEGICSHFLFDTKTVYYGGSGQKFDWAVLNAYKGKTPFFLSGGISADDVKEIKKLCHSQLYGLDINSRFELEPALKDIQLIDKFIKEIKP